MPFTHTHTHTHTHTSLLSDLTVDLDITSVSALDCCDLWFLWKLWRKSRLPKTTGNVSSVQSLRHVRLFATPWTAAHQTSLSFTISRNLLKLMSIELVMPSNHLVLCRPLLLLPSIFPSIRVFSSEWVLHIRWQPMYWSFIFSISPSNEYSGLISFRIDWFDFLAVQGTLKSLLQHYSAKSINSSALSFLYGSILTSIHDYWKNHSWECGCINGKVGCINGEGGSVCFVFSDNCGYHFSLLLHQNS